MFKKFGFIKSITLILLAGKIFKDYSMFSWLEVFTPIIVGIFVTLLLDLLISVNNWASKVETDGLL